MNKNREKHRRGEEHPYFLIKKEIVPTSVLRAPCPGVIPSELFLCHKDKTSLIKTSDYGRKNQKSATTSRRWSLSDDADLVVVA